MPVLHQMHVSGNCYKVRLCARQAGFRSMLGDVLADNARMLGLMESMGFTSLPHAEDRSARRVVKQLNG